MVLPFIVINWMNTLYDALTAMDRIKLVLSTNEELVSYDDILTQYVIDREMNGNICTPRMVIFAYIDINSLEKREIKEYISKVCYVLLKRELAEVIADDITLFVKNESFIPGNSVFQDPELF